jgi:hypothetical protein
MLPVTIRGWNRLGQVRRRYQPGPIEEEPRKGQSILGRQERINSCSLSIPSAIVAPLGNMSSGGNIPYFV